MAGAYGGIYGPGLYAGWDAGLRHRAFEAGVLGDQASAIFGATVRSRGAYLGAGWDLLPYITVHAAMVGGRHTWTNAGSSGLFDVGVSGEAPYAGLRLLGEIRTPRPWSFGLGLVVMITDDLTRQTKDIPADHGFFGHPAESRTVGEPGAGAALRLALDFGDLPGLRS